MKFFLTIVLLVVSVAAAQAQTSMKTLAYNATNNVVFGPTNTNALSFTNRVSFSNAITFGTNSAVTRSNLSLGLSALTNTNADTFRTALGLGAANATFDFLYSESAGIVTLTVNALNSDYGGLFEDQGIGAINVLQPLSFGGNEGVTRTNLGLPLNALTSESVSDFRSAINLGLSALTNDSVSTFRSAINLGWSALTNTNSTNFRSAIGLSPNGIANFSNVQLSSFPSGNSTGFVTHSASQLKLSGTNVSSGTPAFYCWDGYESSALNASNARVAMFSNAGITTNVSITDGTNFWLLHFQNGLLTQFELSE